MDGNGPCDAASSVGRLFVCKSDRIADDAASPTPHCHDTSGVDSAGMRHDCQNRGAAFLQLI